MNNSGQIVGSSYNLTNNALNQGFLYQNGIMTSLTSLLPSGSAWTVTAGIAINDKGQILALANDASGEHDVLLTPSNLAAPPDAVLPPMPVPEPSTVIVFGAWRRVWQRVARALSTLIDARSVIPL